MRLPIAGGHGAEIRSRPQARSIAAGAAAADALKRELATIAAAGPGIILEDKDYSPPSTTVWRPKEPVVRESVLAICAAQKAPVEILPGKSVFEVKSAGFDKGTGVRELMRHKPFNTRRPVFIGDDITDEAALAVMPEFDGVGISVGRRIPGVSLCFDTPAEVRAWLEQLAHAEAVAAQ